jgi:hypothetical protein
MNKEMEKSSENGMFLDGRDYTASLQNDCAACWQRRLFQ